MKIIVVGNAASLLKEKNGEFIDSFDVVIRLNKFVIKGYEEYVGKKTNIYCSKWFNMNYNINNLSNYSKIWLPYPKPPNWWTSKGNFKEVTEQEHLNNINKFNLNIDNIVYLNEDRAKEIELIFKNVCQPSTGLICLMMTIQEYSDHNISYTGFDNFNSGWYWDITHNCVEGMQNSVIFEKIFLNYIKTNYDVNKI
jgi:hypothetical protein